MKIILLRPARIVTSIILCVSLATACKSGGRGIPAPIPAPIPVDAISASATVTLDAANSVANTGNANQSGVLMLVSSAAQSTATFAGDPALVAPGDTLTGQILSIGDGVGSRFSMSGSFTSAPSETDGVFSDFSIDIRNPSENQSVRVSFRAIVSNAVSATGANAYAYSGLSVRDDANIEVYFSEHRIDTKNPVNKLAADAASNAFSIVLLPGERTRVSALQYQRGGVNGPGDYAATLDAFIRIEGIDLI
jgi:hypothetical protein